MGSLRYGKWVIYWKLFQIFHNETVAFGTVKYTCELFYATKVTSFRDHT